MSFFRQYSLIIGSLIFFLVVIMLVSVPSNILAPQATFIGAELRYASENETQVRTRMDFGDISHLQAFPKRFGDWIGLEFNPSESAEALGADLIILRTYLNITYYQPVHLIIMQSRDPSSFHPPPVCYRASNWAIDEEAVEEVVVSDVTWTRSARPVSITVKMMLASREVAGGEKQREVVLYYYVKGRLFNNVVTMIEVSASAPPDGSYQEELSAVKGFIGETIPFMFEHVERENEILIIYLARTWGGRAIIVILILVPLAVIIYPRIRRR